VTRSREEQRHANHRSRTPLGSRHRTGANNPRSRADHGAGWHWRVAVIDGEHLIGIVTDRDLVRRGLARDLPADARIDAVMTAPVVTVDADADLHDAFALFRTHAVRRLALVRVPASSLA